jgi:flagellar motor switch protein FliG
MDPRNLIGSVKAAILVHALGWDAVAPLVDQLDPGEQRLIRKLQSNLGSISPALVERVAQEFLEKASPPKQIEGGVKAGTSRFAQKEPDDAHANNLKAIQSIAPDVLIQMIQNEHPQTIALMIAHLKPRVASEVMALLPDQ